MSIWSDIQDRSSGETVRKEDQQQFDEEKEVVTEKVFKLLSWYKQHNIGLDTGMGKGHPELDKLLKGWKVSWEMVDIDRYWELRLYKEDKRDYVISHIGKRLMNKWVGEIVDYCLRHPLT